jgi:hypothetical protein
MTTTADRPKEHGGLPRRRGFIPGEVSAERLLRLLRARVKNFLRTVLGNRAKPAENYFHESSAGIHDVSYWVGHTNVATTSQYLKTTVERLERVVRTFEESRSIARRLPTEESAA